MTLHSQFVKNRLLCVIKFCMITIEIAAFFINVKLDLLKDTLSPQFYFFALLPNKPHFLFLFNSLPQSKNFASIDLLNAFPRQVPFK